MDEQLTFLTANVRGLGEYKKRKIIYNMINEYRADVILLQETHNTIKTAKLWKSEWGGEWLNCYGTSAARGVSILYRKSEKIKLNNVFRDEAGRILICTITCNDETYTVANVYGPNTDDPDFF